MVQEYKIYALKHPLTNNIRYIGVTVSSLNQRLSQHKYAAFTKKADMHVSKWFRKLKEENLIPIISLLENVKKENWEEREKHWIKQFNNLTNIREGGQGVIIDRSLESRQRSINAHKKSILLLDKENNIINEFSSLKECSLFLNVGISSISNALKNNGSTCGYIVVYKNNYNKSNLISYTGRYKTVYQYDFNCNLINTYNSIKDAFQNVKPCKYSSGIQEAIKNKGACGKYFWSTEKIKNFEPYIKKLKFNCKI